MSQPLTGGAVNQEAASAPITSAAVPGCFWNLPRALLSLALIFLLAPFDSFVVALGRVSVSPHLRGIALGADTQPLSAGGTGVGGRPAPAATAASPPLPAGGGGSGPDVEWWEECQAALACGDCGVARDAALPPFQLPHVFDSLRATVDRADYTRSAVMAAFAEALGSVPELARPRPFFTALETSFDVEHHGWPDYHDKGKVPYKDECVFDGEAACDVHKFRVERPLTEAQRSDAGASTGHAFLKRAPYDFQMYSQTFEHLYDPPLALARMFDLAAPGGLVWASVPAWNIIHMNPSHQQGVTPCGLFSLFRGAGFEVLRLGWFGNEEYSAVLTMPGRSWPPWTELPFGDPFKGMPHSAPGGRVNTVWALARRPAAGQPPLPLPAPRPSAAQLDDRPTLTVDDMVDAAEVKNAVAPGPSAATLDALLRRFPEWATQDVAALALAGYAQEALLPRLAGGGGAPLLLFGRTANAIAAALFSTTVTLRRWVPAGLQRADSAPLRGGGGGGGSGGGAQPRARAAFLTDLFESTRDPLAVLTSALGEVEPGSPLLISCRTADVVAVGRPTLGVCTELGLTQLLRRAGLLEFGGDAKGYSSMAASYGAFGRVKYTQAAVARGEHMSLADFARAQLQNNEKRAAGGGEGLLRALAEGRPVEGEAELEKLRWVLEELVADKSTEARFGWAAIAWVVIEAPHKAPGGTLGKNDKG